VLLEVALEDEAATLIATEVRGASNEKAKRELGWQPRHASRRQGFAQGLGSSHDRGRVDQIRLSAFAIACR
jgi:hypothetical protein